MAKQHFVQPDGAVAFSKEIDLFTVVLSLQQTQNMQYLTDFAYRHPFAYYTLGVTICGIMTPYTSSSITVEPVGIIYVAGISLFESLWLEFGVWPCFPKTPTRKEVLPIAAGWSMYWVFLTGWSIRRVTSVFLMHSTERMIRLRYGLIGLLSWHIGLFSTIGIALQFISR